MNRPLGTQMSKRGLEMPLGTGGEKKILKSVGY